MRCRMPVIAGVRSFGYGVPIVCPEGSVVYVVVSQVCCVLMGWWYRLRQEHSVLVWLFSVCGVACALL